MRLAKLTAALCLVTMPACFAITDLDRFKQKQGEAQPVNGNHHLKLTVKGFSSHTQGFFEFRVVDANNFLRMRGVADPMGSVNGDISFFVTNGFPPAAQGPYRVCLFGDKNGNRVFDQEVPDHSWQITNITNDTVAGADNNDDVWEVEQIHNQSWQLFEPAIKDTGLPAKVKLTGMKQYLGEGGTPGRTMELRIADASSGNTVGFWRVEHLVKDAFDVELPGIADDRVSYNVFIWVDANANNTFDNPAGGGDHGWKLPVTANATGFELPFDPTKSPDRTVDLGSRF